MFLDFGKLINLNHYVDCQVVQYRALDLQTLGPNFSPSPKAKKVGFFPSSKEKFPV